MFSAANNQRKFIRLRRRSWAKSLMNAIKNNRRASETNQGIASADSAKRCYGFSRGSFIFALATLSFLLYIWLPASTPFKFNSPDETANYFWAKNFAQNGTLRYAEPLNQAFGDIIHPRSFAVRNGYLLPGSFVGLPILYGFFGRIFGIWILPYLTAGIAILGSLAFYATISKIWGSRIAFSSFLLFLLHPAILYYAERGLFHNIPFVSFLIFASFFYICRPGAHYFSHRWLDDAFGASMLGAAIFFRASEFVWILPLTLALLLITNGWKKAKRTIVMSLIILGIFGAALLTVNYFIYGSALRFGYEITPRTATEVIDGADAEVTTLPGEVLSLRSIRQRLAQIFLPFGFAPRIVLYSAYFYFLKLFWWITIPTIFGLTYAFLLLIKRRLSRKQAYYVITSIVVTAYLFIYYGSFKLQDNPTAGLITMTSSYLRYWLPVFVLLVPFFAFFLEVSIKRIRNQRTQFVLGGLMMLFAGVLSLHLIFFEHDDGLSAIKNRLHYFMAVQDRVAQLTSNNAIIIVDRGDKIFFPDRKVIYPLRDKKNLAAIPKLILQAPVFYYGIGLNYKELQMLNTIFKESGLVLRRVEIFGKEALYKFSSVLAS